MSNRVKVSVVVPVYNVSQYLRECLDSLIYQTLKEIEIICVNDGSTDNSLSILEEYAQRDARVKIIDKPNSGYGNSMNRGISAATGEYIGILESDDYVMVDMYERLYDKAKELDLDIVKADFYRFFNENGKLDLFYNSITYNRRDFYNRVMCPRDEKYAFRCIMNTWSGIYKRSFLEENHIDHNETPGASFQDNGFWFKTFSLAERVMFMDTPFYMNRRDNPNSSVHDKGKVFAVSREYEMVYEFLKARPHLYEDLIGIYWLKKYHNYLFSYNRIGDEHKPVFLEHFTNEYRNAREKGELDSSLFSEAEWEVVSNIMDNPVQFVENNRNAQKYKFSTSEETKTDEKIAVSVIIPVFNAGEYLRQCLDSIVRQTVHNIEIICVDDGSTDNSMEILKEYQEKDNRFIILSQDNQGAGAARNKGLDIAKGEYLSFLDADDFFEYDLFERTIKQSERHNADICVYKIEEYDNNTHKGHWAEHAFRTQYIPDRPAFSYRSMPDYIFSTFQNWAWNKLFRHEFIKEKGIRFQEIFRTNDLFFTCTALVKAEIITLYKGKMLAHYRVGMATNCQATNDRSPLDFLEAFLALKEELIKMGIYEKVERSFVNQSLSGCIHNLQSVKNFEKYEIIYNRLIKEGGFEQLGITKHTEGYFYFKERYKSYRELMDNPMAKPIFDKCVEAQNNLKNVKPVEVENDNSAEFDRLSEENKLKSAEIERLKTEISGYKEFADGLQEDIDKIKSDYEKRVENLRNGYFELSYRENFSVLRPKISVIVPVYNKQQYIAHCIESICVQTLKDIEIICINDGSTDDSLAELVNLHRKDSRILIINQENKGSGPARNAGLKIAGGEYAAFIDADDWYPSADVLETLYNKAKDKNALICGGGFRMVQDGTLIEEFEGIYSAYRFDKEGFVEYKDYQFDYGYHRFIYNLDMIRNNNIYFPDYRRFQDPPFFIKSMITAKKFYAVNKTVYSYRACYQDIGWDNRKVNDLVRGLIDNLKMSAENGLAKLHHINVTRLNEEFAQLITEHITPDNTQLLNMLITASSLIDTNLLSKEYPDTDESIKTKIIENIVINVKNELSECRNAVNGAVTRLNEIADRAVFLENENCQLKERVSQQQNNEIADRDRIIADITAEKDRLIRERDNSNSDRNRLIAESDGLRADRDRLSEERDNLISDRDYINSERDRLTLENEQLKAELERYKFELNATRTALSHKVGMFVTYVPRKVKGVFRKN